MASPAYSTPALIPQHGPVTRAVIAMRGGSDPEEHRGLGCVILDEPVFFDSKSYPEPGAPALVVFGDGRMAVVPMPGLEDDPRQGMNPGFLMVRVDKPKARGIRVIREQAALVGAVRVLR